SSRGTCRPGGSVGEFGARFDASRRPPPGEPRVRLSARFRHTAATELGQTRVCPSSVPLGVGRRKTRARRQRVKIGFAGLGWAARGFHLPAARRTQGVEAVGGFDSSAEQRASWTKETGLPGFETFDELLDRTQPELLVVATPPDSHTELCLSA